MSDEAAINTDPLEAAKQAALLAAEAASRAAQAAAKAQKDAEEAIARAEALAGQGVVAPATGTSTKPTGPLTDAQIDTIRAGYEFEGPALSLGALKNGDPLADVQIRVPLPMTNRHGLVAGATGTGKTRTLQGLVEQFSDAGVPVFAPDMKGDLSGMIVPGDGNEKLLARTAALGQQWSPKTFPVEFFSLGGVGPGVPIRATVSGFGSVLLSKVLGLNSTQESSLGLVFHYADKAGLPLLDLSDLRAVLSYLADDQGKEELKNLGGLSKQTAGVILRKLIVFADQGADRFFGEPEFDVKEFLRVGPEGRGQVSLLELPDIHDSPALFSTFIMWLLAELFEVLPEVGDLEKPKLVFFFDEAHLLFAGASKDFLAAVVQTVRLIRSKGVGIFFVTQTPKDVPSDVLGQLGTRIQHQLRAHTPDDANALRATVRTYPKSGYDLEQVLTNLGTGEAIVTVIDEKGAPTPVAWTRLRAPESSMDAADPNLVAQTVARSSLQPKYGTAIDRDSAREMLERRLQADAAAAEMARQQEEAAKAQAKADKEALKAAEAAQRKAEQEAARAAKARTQSSSKSRKTSQNPLDGLFGSANSVGNTVVREVVRGLFGNRRR